MWFMYLTDILYLLLAASFRAKVYFERSVEELYKHLKAYSRDGWIIAAFAKLIPYERIYQMH